jgi:hypothetical protein
LRVNGSVVLYLKDNVHSAATTQAVSLNGSVSYPFNKGDLVVITAFQNATASLSLDGTAARNYFSIFKIQTPQSIGQSEVVGAKYTTGTAHSIANSTDTYVDYGTKVYDTHNAVLGAGGGIVTTTGTGWRFIVPVSGIYTINASVLFASSSAWASGEAARIDVFKNGATLRALDRKDMYTSVGSPLVHIHGTTDGSFVKGDRIEIVVNQQSGGALTFNSASPHFNQVDIKKVG